MRILSFDQSTLVTGWAVFDEGIYLTHGVVDLHKIKDSSNRFEQMCSSIRNLIFAYHPDEIVLEDVMLMKSP